MISATTAAASAHRPDFSRFIASSIVIDTRFALSIYTPNSDNSLSIAAHACSGRFDQLHSKASEKHDINGDNSSRRSSTRRRSENQSDVLRYTPARESAFSAAAPSSSTLRSATAVYDAIPCVTPASTLTTVNAARAAIISRRTITCDLRRYGPTSRRRARSLQNGMSSRCP